MADIVGTAFVRVKALTDQLAKDIEKDYKKGLQNANLEKAARDKGESVGEEFGEGMADETESTLKSRAKNLVPEDDIRDGFKNTFKGIRADIDQLDLFESVQEQFDQIDLFTDAEIDVPIGLDTTVADREREEFLNKTRAAFGSLGGDIGSELGDGLGDSLDASLGNRLGDSLNDSLAEATEAFARIGGDAGEDFANELSDSAEKTIKTRFKTIVPEDDIRDGLRGTIRGVRAEFSQLDLFGDISENFDQLSFDLPGLDIDVDPIEEAFEEVRQAQNRLADDTDNGSLGKSLDKLSAKFKNLGKTGGLSLGLLQSSLLLIGGAIVAALPYIQDVGAAVLAYATGLVAQVGFLATGLVGLGAAAGAAIGGAILPIIPILVAFQAKTEFLAHFMESLKDTGEQFLQVGVATQLTLLPALDEALLILEDLIPMFSEFGLFVGQAVGQFSLFAAGTLAGNEAQGRFQEILKSSLRILDQVLPAILNLGDILSGVWVASIPAGERFVGILTDMIARWRLMTVAGLQTGELTKTIDIWFERARVLGSALANVSAALFDILEVGANSSDNVFVRFDEWAKRFRDFTSSEAGQNRLALIFDNALVVMREINGIAADLFDGIFGRLGEVGGVDSMVDALRRFRDFIPEIQEAWANMYDDIKNVVDILGKNIFEKVERAIVRLEEPLGRLADQFFDFLQVMNDTNAFDTFLGLMVILTDTLALLLSIPGFGQFVAYMIAFGAALKVATIALNPFIRGFGTFMSLIISMIKLKVGGELLLAGKGLAAFGAGLKAAKSAETAAAGISAVNAAAKAAGAAGGVGSLAAQLGGAVAGLGGLAVAAGLVAAPLIGLAGFFIQNKLAAMKWEQEIRQATEDIGLLNDGLNITADGVANYIRESSRFETRNQIDDLHRLGLTVDGLAQQIVSGANIYANFTDRALETGEVFAQFRGSGSIVKEFTKVSGDSLEELGEQYELNAEQLDALSKGQAVAVEGGELMIGGNSDLIQSFVELNRIIAASVNDNIDAFATNEQNIRLLGADYLAELKRDISSGETGVDEDIALQARANRDLGEAAREASSGIVGLSDATRDNIAQQVASLSGTERLVTENALLTAEYQKLADQLARDINVFNSAEFERDFGTAKAAVLDFQTVIADASQSKFKIEFGDGIDELTKKFPELAGATKNLFDTLRLLPEEEFRASAAQLGVDADVLREAMNKSQQAIIDLQNQAIESLPSIGELLDKATKTKEDGSSYFDRDGFLKSINDRTNDAANFQRNIEFIRQKLGDEAALMALQQGPEAAANLQMIAGTHPDQLKAALDSMTTAETQLADYIDKTFGPLMAQKYAVEAGVISSSFNVSLVGGLADPRVDQALQDEGLKTLDEIARIYQGRFEIKDGVLRFVPTSNTNPYASRPGNERGNFLSGGGFVGNRSYSIPFRSGPSGTDTVPAWLTPGEFVLRQSVAKSLPASFLTNLNAGDAGLIRMLNSINRDDGFLANSLSSPNRGKPGAIQAEDGSWVLPSFYSKAPAAASTGGTAGATGNVIIQQMNIEGPEPLETARMTSDRLRILQSQLTRR